VEEVIMGRILEIFDLQHLMKKGKKKKEHQ